MKKYLLLANFTATYSETRAAAQRVVPLQPSVAAEIERAFGAKPLNLRDGNYSNSRGYHRYDNSGNQYRVYVR